MTERNAEKDKEMVRDITKEEGRRERYTKEKRERKAKGGEKEKRGSGGDQIGGSDRINGKIDVQISERDILIGKILHGHFLLHRNNRLYVPEVAIYNIQYTSYIYMSYTLVIIL